MARPIFLPLIVNVFNQQFIFEASQKMGEKRVELIFLKHLFLVIQANFFSSCSTMARKTFTSLGAQISTINRLQIIKIIVQLH